MSIEPSEPKLRILCLHGYNQNGAVFKSKLGGFRKSIKTFADLVFVDAPHVNPSEVKGDDGSSKEGRSWWYSTNEDTFSATESTTISKGFQTSVDHIINILHIQGPFDGILGFSQGAAFAALICSLKERGEIPDIFQFVILISGFKSRSACHSHLYEKPCTILSLHIIGKADKVIGRDASESLFDLFKMHSVIYHDGGHFLPTTKDIQLAYKDFLKNMFNRFKIK